MSEEISFWRGVLFFLPFILFILIVIIFASSNINRSSEQKDCDYCDNRGYFMSGNAKIPCPKCGKKREAVLISRKRLF